MNGPTDTVKDEGCTSGGSFTSRHPLLATGWILHVSELEGKMAEVLVEYTDVVTSGGRRFVARACGAETDEGRWQGWLEFVDVDTGEAIRSRRETTQPNRRDTLYWATGLTAVYLEGALERALHPFVKLPAQPAPEPIFDEPASDFEGDPGVDSILNPFSVYRRGEELLRRQLAALSVWHLVNIIRAHGFSDLAPATLNAMAARDLIDLIVAAVKMRQAESMSR